MRKIADKHWIGLDILADEPKDAVSLRELSQSISNRRAQELIDKGYVTLVEKPWGLFVNITEKGTRLLHRIANSARRERR